MDLILDRDDLAYIIRRRGYKLIRELLANSVDMKVHVSDRETNIAEGKEATIANEEESEGKLSSQFSYLFSI